MDHSGYWMWANSIQGVGSSLKPPINSYDDSWEEQAFADDTADPLGGCVWPPRSYSCSFCSREFRSAQALGGHMNVHRRDRARMKQSVSSNTESYLQDNLLPYHLTTPLSSLSFQYPSHICDMVYPCPNPASSPSSRASTSATHNHKYTSSSQRNPIPIPIPIPIPLSLSCSSISEDDIDRYRTPNSQAPSVQDSGKISVKQKVVDLTGCKTKIGILKNDLSVSLNLVIRRNRSTSDDGGEEGSELHVGFKRRKPDQELPSFSESITSRVDFTTLTCTTEELDLELRLGFGQQKATGRVFRVQRE